MDSVDVIGQAIHGCKKKELCLTCIYYIGRLIEEMHGRSALVKIEDDGKISFSIAANGIKQDIF